MTDFQAECSFCAEVDGDRDYNLFYALLGEQIMGRYILRETQNFVVIPAVGSFVEGYLLIGPKQHCLSLGHLPEDTFDELETLMREVQLILSHIYRPPLFFEHGAISFTLRGGCCTDHAHLHIVPVTDGVDLLPIMETGGTEVVKVNSLKQLRVQVRRRIPYLFLRDAQGVMYVRDAPHAASQQLRKSLSSQLAVPEQWDWRAFPGTENILHTIEALSNWEEIAAQCAIS